VRLWVKGTRGPGGFPPPRAVLGERMKIWDWSIVDDWLRNRLGRVLDENRLLSPAEVARVNRTLAPLPEGVAAGVSVTPERVFAVLTDHTGEVFGKASRLIPSPGRPEQAAEAVAKLLSDSNLGSSKAAAPPRLLGVHLGGHVDQHGAIVLTPRYQAGRDWTRIDFRSLLERATGLPTVVQNDANALALYECYFGTGREARTFVVVLLDVGVGAGVVVDGQLLTGWQGAAGEIGHLVVALGGYECACGNVDCLECVAGMANIVRSIGEATGQKLSQLDDALELAIRTIKRRRRCLGQPERRSAAPPPWS
jgi:predicted NBD/HSP70 family sugar kinase